MFIFINVSKIDSFYRYLFYVLNDSKSINHPLILIQLSNFMKKQIDLKFIPIKNSKIFNTWYYWYVKYWFTHNILNICFQIRALYYIFVWPHSIKPIVISILPEILYRRRKYVLLEVEKVKTSMLVVWVIQAFYHFIYWIFVRRPYRKNWNFVHFFYKPLVCIIHYNYTSLFAHSGCRFEQII
jgi:hypothetical protein